MASIKEKILKIREKKAAERGEINLDVTLEINLIDNGERFYTNLGSEKEAQTQLEFLRDIYKRRRGRIVFKARPFSVSFVEKDPVGDIKPCDWLKSEGFSIWFSPPKANI